MSAHGPTAPIAGIRNARVHDPAEGLKSVDLAIDDGRLADGPIGAGEVIDAGGAIVHPGFVDAHIHLSLGGSTMQQLDLSGAHGRAAFEEAITTHANTLEDGHWLQALGWSEANWPDRALPTAEWLAGAGDRPCVCYRMDQHACVVNAPVLEMLEGVECPPGGEIVRDASGAPTGLMLESAAWQLVNPLVPEPSSMQRRAMVRSAAAHCASHGIVAVGSMEYASIVQDGFLPIRDELGIRVLVTLLERTLPLDFSFAEAFENDEHLAIIGFKSFLDGTFGSRTAAMLEPWSGDPSQGSGMLIELAEEGVLEKWIQAVHQHGFSASMHAIGDRAVRLALDVADTLDASERARVRFEHVQMIHPEDIPRMRGRFASMQPLHKTYDALTAEERLGTERLERFFAFNALLEAGARLAFGSDWPIVSCDPIEAIRAAVTGIDLDGRAFEVEANIPIAAALEAYTTEARACLGLPGGGISPGAPADLVLLDRDPHGTDWASGEAPKVLTTIVAGRIVHDAR